MLKKLILCLVLAMALVIGPIGGRAMAIEEGQICTMNAGAKIFIASPNGNAIPVIANRDLQITIGKKVTTEGAADLNKIVGGMGETGMDWTNANLAIVEADGNFIIIRDEDVKDCK